MPACLICGIVKPPVSFRRWANTPRGPKRMLHTTCNECVPEKPPSEIPRKQLDAAVAAGRVPRSTAQQMRDGMAKKIATTRGRMAQLRVLTRRATEWDVRIRSALRTERGWINERLRQRKVQENPALMAFLTAYLKLITHMIAATRYAHQFPTTSDAAYNPRSYTDSQTMMQLRELYRQTAGLWPANTRHDVAFLEW